mmetsp:Transcript_15356/g.46017  ORF Transcript_15356/g.46017 Transcript_15356/m.46017 type:complete len:217 (-) Transcript_15356:84-734(-)
MSICISRACRKAAAEGASLRAALRAAFSLYICVRRASSGVAGPPCQASRAQWCRSRRSMAAASPLGTWITSTWGRKCCTSRTSAGLSSRKTKDSRLSPSSSARRSRLATLEPWWTCHAASWESCRAMSPQRSRKTRRTSSSASFLEARQTRAPERWSRERRSWSSRSGPSMPTRPAPSSETAPDHRVWSQSLAKTFSRGRRWPPTARRTASVQAAP